MSLGLTTATTTTNHRPPTTKHHLTSPTTNHLQTAFADCALKVCQDPATLSLFTSAAEGLDPATAKACGEQGGTAYVDFLFEAAGEGLAEAITEVSKQVLATHKLTKVSRDKRSNRPILDFFCKSSSSSSSVFYFVFLLPKIWGNSISACNAAAKALKMVR